MSVPTITRKLILDDYQAALEAIVSGAEYRHTMTVGRAARAPDGINVSECPYTVLVGGAEPIGELMVSQKARDIMEVVMQTTIKPDPDRWPNMSSAELAEEVLADMKKAIDKKPDRGVQAFRSARDIDVAHHLEGAYSVIVFTDTLETRRAR